MTLAAATFDIGDVDALSRSPLDRARDPSTAPERLAFYAQPGTTDEVSWAALANPNCHWDVWDRWLWVFDSWQHEHRKEMTERFLCALASNPSLPLRRLQEPEGVWEINLVHEVLRTAYHKAVVAFPQPVGPRDPVHYHPPMPSLLDGVVDFFRERCNGWPRPARVDEIRNESADDPIPQIVFSFIVASRHLGKENGDKCGFVVTPRMLRAESEGAFLLDELAAWLQQQGAPGVERLHSQALALAEPWRHDGFLRTWAHG